MGIDINFDDVVETKKRLDTHKELGDHGGGECVVSVADICELPFKGNFFDLVIGSERLDGLAGALLAQSYLRLRAGYLVG